MRLNKEERQTGKETFETEEGISCELEEEEGKRGRVKEGIT